MASKKDANIFNSECKIWKVDLASEIRGLKFDPETGDIWLSLQDKSICKYSRQHGFSKVANFGSMQTQNTLDRVHFEFLPKQPGHESSRVVICGKGLPEFLQIHNDGKVTRQSVANKANSMMGLGKAAGWYQRAPAFHCVARMQHGELVIGDGNSSVGLVDTTNWRRTNVPIPSNLKLVAVGARDANTCFLLTRARNSSGVSESGPYIFDRRDNSLTPIKVDCDGLSFGDPSLCELNCSIIGVPVVGRNPIIDDIPTHSNIIIQNGWPLLFQNSASGQWNQHPTITDASMGDYYHDTNTLVYASRSDPKTLFVVEPFFNHASFYPSPHINIPLLRDSSGAIPTDATFTHTASGTVFHLHSFVLPPHLNIATILKHLTSTTVPLQVVQNYIAALYLDEAHHPTNIKTSPWTDSAAQSLANAALVTHLLHLTSCNAHSGPYEESLMEKLDAIEVDEVLLKVFLPIWPHCYNNSRIRDLFACTLRRDPMSLARNAKAMCLAGTEELHSPILRLSMNVGNPTHLLTPPTAAKHREYIMNVAVDEGYLLEWTSMPLSPPSASAPYAFAFGIDGIPGHVIVPSGWILFASWSWFRRVLKANMNESRTRSIKMPSSMSPALLVTLLRRLHGIFDRRWKKLPVSDHITMLAVCDELELRDTFALELQHCDTTFRNSLTPSTCLKMLRQCWELDQQNLVDIAIDYITSNWAEVAVQSRTDLNLPPRLMSALTDKLVITT